MEIKIDIDEDKLKKAANILRPLALGFINFTDSLEEKEDEQPNLPVSEVQKKEKIIVENKQYSFSEVRTILTEKSRNGFTEQVKELVTKYGNGKLSGVKPENYADLILETEFFCREPYTKEEVSKRIEELKKEGYADELPSLLEHHYAASAEDLKAEYYSSFMRDAWRLDHAWK